MINPIEVEAVVIEEPTAELAVTYTPAIIDDNLSALDAYIEDQIKPYQDAVIDPDDEQQIKDGRKAMADLNKLKEPIETERKRVKREYEAPLKAFEARVKSITAKIDKARAEIKKQIDEADAAFKASRTEQLQEEYEAVAGELTKMIPLEAIMKTEWLRRSTSWAKVANELAESAAKALEGYTTLEAKELTHKDEVMRKYCETLDLMAALQLEDALVAEDQRMAEFKAAQAAVMPQPQPEPIPEPEPTPEPTPEPQATVYEWELVTVFVGPKSQAQAVGQALKSCGVTGTIKCKGYANA